MSAVVLWLMLSMVKLEFWTYLAAGRSVHIIRLSRDTWLLA
jgi:hypothetical protein